MASRGTILMIDDDELPNYIYVDRLTKGGFDVIKCLKTKEMQPLIERHRERLVLITLDIMMAPGIYSSEETDGGLSTGIEAYKDIRRQLPKIPIICFTLRGAFTRSDLDENDANLIVAHKLECVPGDLLAEIDRMLIGC
jgi:CheY-like chemotaxis protein